MKANIFTAYVAIALLGCGSDSTPSGATGTVGATTTTTATGAGGQSGAGGAGSGGGVAGSGGQAGSGGAGEGGSGAGGSLVFDWSCVGHVEWPKSDGKPITATAVFLDFQTQAPIAGAAVLACAKDDPDCAAPHDQGVTDAAGKVTLTAPGGEIGFDGFVRASVAGYVTNTFFFGQPLAASPQTGANFYLFADASFAGLLGLVGEQADPTRGHFAITAEDCAPKPAAGLTVAADAADASSSTYYVDGKVPSKTAAKTDASGGAAVLNLPPGPVTITTKLVVTQETLGAFAAFVRAGEISSVVLPPTP